MKKKKRKGWGGWSNGHDPARWSQKALGSFVQEFYNCSRHNLTQASSVFFFCFAVAIVRFTTSREFRTVLTAGHLKQTIVGFSNLSLSQVWINFSFSFMTYHQFQSCVTQLRTCDYWLSSL